MALHPPHTLQQDAPTYYPLPHKNLWSLQPQGNCHGNVAPPASIIIKHRLRRRRSVTPYYYTIDSAHPSYYPHINTRKDVIYCLHPLSL
ncbi:hypothetical protein BGZ95_001974 [Linnemannia exigua]|uniref:Uncharacterized protein n=1 Tax=Linnemannia exigua TaxID=604196 RepID=A0AAD4D645_9FUNG|nr:hypothetical protein BGZ95_001974 [Linnemannia exigua]